MKTLLKDLFYDATNTHLDAARLFAMLVLLSVPASAAWNAYLGNPINIPEFSASLTGTWGAVAIYLTKDRSRSPGA